MIWIHDYHLMLVPQMLRAMCKDKKRVKIGFFLHTPYPSHEFFHILPMKDRVLRGVLNSDLIGFHTYDYVRHFLSSCGKTLQLETMPNGVSFDGRIVQVGAFPIGIQPKKFTEGVKQDSVLQRISNLKQHYQDMEIIVGIDRLDYIKGLPHKLHAMDMFLQGYPKYRGRLVLIQVAIPSRENVKEYQRLRSTCEEMVGHINGKYAEIDYQPIIFKYSKIPFEDMIALFSIANVCLVTSTRDGMNLVALEYIACQEASHGQLVMSEFAGAAQGIKGCIIINPWDTGSIIQGISDALEMSPTQKAANFKQMFDYVLTFTSAAWGASFVTQLKNLDNPCGRRDRRKSAPPLRPIPGKEKCESRSDSVMSS